jgi:hypothetical protein
MVTKNLLVRGGADFSSLNKSLKRVNKNLNLFKGVATKAFAVMTAAVAAIGIKKSLDAIDYQIMQETKLAVIMRQRMGATDQMIQSVKNLTSVQQSLGVIGDEVQLAGAQQLATFLKTSEALETLIPAMNNLAAQQKGVNATGEDLAGIATMIGKVLDGNVGALKRVGISFSDADRRLLEFGNEAERAATLAKVIDKNVGQMNRALANTSAGRVKQMKNTFGDLREEVGRLILPLRDAIVPLLKRMADVGIRAVKSLQSAFSGFAMFLHALFGTKPPTEMESGAVESAEAIGDAYEVAGKKVKGSVAGFDEVNQLSQDSQSGVAPAVPTLESAMGSGFFGIDTEKVSDEATELAEKIKNAFKDLEPNFESLKKSASDFFNLFKKETQSSIKTDYGGALKKVTKEILSQLEGAFDIATGLGLIVKAMEDFFNFRFEKSGQNFVDAAKKIGEGLAKMFLGENQEKALKDFIANSTKSIKEFGTSIKDWWDKNISLKINFDKAFEGIKKTMGLILIYMSTIFLNDWKASWALVLDVIKWDAIKDKLVATWDSTKTATTTKLAEITEVIKTWWSSLTTPGVILWGSVRDKIIAWWDQTKTDMAPKLSSIRNDVKTWWASFTQPGVILWGSVRDKVLAWWDQTKTDMAPKLSSIMNDVKTWWASFTQPGVILWGSVRDKVLAWWTTTKNDVAPALKKIRDEVSLAWAKFTDGVSIKWSSVSFAVLAVWSKLKSDTASVWQSIVDDVKNKINSLISGVNSFINKVNGISIKIPEIEIPLVGKVGGYTVGFPAIPTIPKLAQGGIVGANSPMLAMVGDNRTQKEAIAPVDDLMGMISSAVLAAMSVQGGRSGDIVLNIDGVSFARATNVYQAKESTRIGANMITVS